jgi:UDP-N-acetylglucosamine 2-epimerase (non-hydrolysing)/UDP-GlcNAc3NAcA epimerase
MPEELNRVLTDHMSDLLLCSTDVAIANLEREDAAGRAVLVGDVMIDVALLFAPRARARLDVLEREGLAPGEYLLVTAHRAGNVDDPQQLTALVELLLDQTLPVVLPLHPRTLSRLTEFDLLSRLEAAATVRLLPPLGYLDFTALLCHAHAVLTDSGGVQKEAYLAGVRCVTLRDTTEWVETVASGWNALVGLDPQLARAALARDLPDERPELYGDGRAGERVVAALEEMARG